VKDALVKFLNVIASGGPWPLVVLVLGSLGLVLGLFLGVFIIVQRGRKNATLKLWIASIDISGEIEERPARRETNKKIPPDPPATGGRKFNLDDDD
jgi:hypothetical protein